jgi:hypothetical protein
LANIDDLMVPKVAKENLEANIDVLPVPVAKGEELMDELMVPEANKENVDEYLPVHEAAKETLEAVANGEELMGELMVPEANEENMAKLDDLIVPEAVEDSLANLDDLPVHKAAKENLEPKVKAAVTNFIDLILGIGLIWSGKAVKMCLITCSMH